MCGEQQSSRLDRLVKIHLTRFVDLLSHVFHAGRVVKYPLDTRFSASFSTKLPLLSSFLTMTSLTASIIDWITESSFAIISMMAARKSPFAGFVESTMQSDSELTFTFDLGRPAFFL